MCEIMIRPVDALAPKVLFKGQNYDSENPVNRRFERRLALLNAGSISIITGAATMLIARSYTSSWKHASWFGIGAGIITMLFAAPRFLYKAGIKAYTKEKEMDVFTKEKEVQKKLLSDVDEAIQNHSEDLPEKLENYSKSKEKSIPNPSVKPFRYRNLLAQS